MIAGYITFEELKLITGFSDGFLYNLLAKGLVFHEADLKYNQTEKRGLERDYKKNLFNLKEVENWLKVHVF